MKPSKSIVLIQMSLILKKIWVTLVLYLVDHVCCGENVVQITKLVILLFQIKATKIFKNNEIINRQVNLSSMFHKGNKTLSCKLLPKTKLIIFIFFMIFVHTYYSSDAEIATF